MIQPAPPITVRVEHHGAVAILLLPPAGVLSAIVRAELQEAVARASRHPATQAIVIAWEQSARAPGAAREEDDEDDPDDAARDGWMEPPAAPDVLLALEACDKPVVAALRGAPRGAAFEVALACHARVIDPDGGVGAPEVKSGLSPGAGGTQRVARLAGACVALDLCASGRIMPAVEALDCGLVDAIAAGDLRAAAIAHARGLVGAPPRRACARQPPFDAAAFEAAAAQALKKARGALAPSRIIASIRAAQGDFANGAAVERAHFLELLASDQSKAMRYGRLAARAAQETPHLEGIAPRPVGAVGVIGAGAMGVGIAIALINAGTPVTVVDTSADALEGGVRRIRDAWARDVRLGRIAPHEHDARLARLTMTTRFDALAECDLVIEAVFEEMALKKAVFGQLGALAKPGAVLASNTSYLDIDVLGAAAGRPQDVIGLHFFSPANIMRLVEVVEGERSARDAVRTGVAISRRIGKMPIVVGVCDGFVGNRILTAWRCVADMLVEEGATPQAIDAAMEDWGMAMGPYAVADLAGLDIGMRRRKERAALRDPAARDTAAVADALCALGRYGQKTGAGYYTYANGARAPDPIVDAIIARVSNEKGVTRKPIAAATIIAFLHAAMVNEACAILADGIVARPLAIDMVKVHGYGFPAWRGGPLWEADRIGLGVVLETVKDIHKMAGAGFAPADLLVWMVDHRKTFAACAAEGACAWTNRKPA